MKKNNLTIIIQPDWSTYSKIISSIISFSFPKRAKYSLILCTIMFILFGLNGAFSIRENISIKNRIASLQASVDNLGRIESKVRSIRKDEKITRESLGLKSWDNNFDINERLGRGGSESSSDEKDFDIPSLDVDQEIKEINDTLPLHARVNDLKEDVHELLLILLKRRETLNCRPTIMPVKDDEILITSGFGWRKGPFTGLKEFHKGLDISGRKGAIIIATADGVVEKVGYNRFKGKYIKIKHDQRFSTIYGHLLKYIVKPKQSVKRGQVIGYMGTSGMSTGYHVHYMVIDNNKKVNPYNFILNRDEHMLALAN